MARFRHSIDSAGWAGHAGADDGWAGPHGTARKPAARAYQLAFFTPGISPLLASCRKQMRQIPNLR
jgi:hypothetical protein